jgi:hypothetical protein
MIESKIMQRASEKCHLEALVIAKGSSAIPPFFLSPCMQAARNQHELYNADRWQYQGRRDTTIAEMAAQLLKGEHTSRWC